MAGIEPSHQCNQCGQHYHLSCAELEPGCIDKSLCLNCARKPQKSLLKLVSPSMGTHGSGMPSLASPVVLSPCVVTVSSLSSVLSKPLMTTSSHFLPQVLSPIFLISGQNSAAIPPPPPLASCPRFDTPVTLLPVQFTSDVPPPPRLHLCTIPQACHPPPLHIGPGLPSYSQTSTFLAQLPTLQSCPPLLTSKPTIQPTMTTSSCLKIVARANKFKTQPATRYVLIPAPPEVSQPGPLPTTALQTPLVASVSELSGAVVVEHSSNLEEAGPGGNVPVNEATKSVRNLSKQTRASSPSSGSDIDDYPPVSFGPVTTESSICLLTQAEPPVSFAHMTTLNSAPLLREPEIAGKRQKLDFKIISRQDDQHFSTTRPPRMIKDLLSRIADGTHSRVPASLPSAQDNDSSNSHIFSVHADLSGNTVISTNILAESNSQLLTVPHSVASRPNLSGTELPPDIYNNISAQSLLNFNICDPTADLLEMSTVLSHLHPERKYTVEPKLTRKNFMSSFRILQTSFPILMKIFRCLSIPDLLRASCVCKVWRLLILQPDLWRQVRMEGVRIMNWEEATRFLRLVGVKSLKLTSSVLQASENVSSADVWNNIQRTIPTLTCLEQLFFDQVPSSVLDAITDKMPHLINIGAESVMDSGCFSVTPMIPSAKTVENMSHAIEAVTSGRVSTSNAAKLFQVSERDLIHLTQTSDKLTSEEETAVLLCCMRLSRMGFSVQKDTMVSKCQEMLGRRFFTTSPIPISDSCCNDLYHRNVPLFTPETEVKTDDTLRKRFDVHYSALRRLYNGLWPRATLSAGQVLMFDLKPFHLDKEPGFNSLRSVAVTVLSLTPASTRSLPVMIVWPKFVETAHPFLISVMSKRGMPSFLHVCQYFQKILSQVKERPLVILCNGNASLLSEKLVSSCVSDSVYLYCVPPDIAKFAFPGFHGGLLHILKAQIPDLGLKCGEFASRLLSLLKSKKKTIRHSTKLAFTTTGVFPLNSRAPTQYQAVDLNSVPHQQFSWRKSGHFTGRRSSRSSRGACEIIVVAKPDDLDCDEVVMNQKDVRKRINEHGKDRLKNKAKKSKSYQAHSGLPEKMAHSVTSATGKEHKRVNYAHMLAKKVLSQAKSGQSSFRTVAVKIKKPCFSLISNDNLNSGTTRSDVETEHQEHAQTHQVPRIYSVQSPLPLQDSHTKHVVPFAEKVNKLVDHGAETQVGQSDITSCNINFNSTNFSQNKVKIQDSSCVTAEIEMCANLDSKKQTTADSVIGCETNQITSPSKDKHMAGDILHISRMMNNSGSSDITCQQSEENSKNTEMPALDEQMEVDAIGGNVNEVDKTDLNSLKLSGTCSSNRNNYKKNKDSKKKLKSRKLSTSKKGKMHVVKNKESLTISPVTKKKHKKKKQPREKLPQTSCSNTPETTTPKYFISGNGKPETCNDKLHTDQDCQLKLLGQISLIDHDYVLKFEGCRTSSSCDSHKADFPFPESNEVTVDQVQVETAPEVRSPADDMPPAGAVCRISHEDMIHVVTDDVTETVVYTQQCESSDNISHDVSGSIKSVISGHSSSSSSRSRSDTEITSPAKRRSRNTSVLGNRTEDKSSSSSTDSQTSDDEDAGSSESNSDDNRQTSDLDADDDDSRCQMCMRSTPPHSKDKIIDWVDCDENCGRWFHVICVVRSQSKADAKHFVCPSCRCKR